MKEITDAMIDRHWAWNDPAYWDDDPEEEEEEVEEEDEDENDYL